MNAGVQKLCVSFDRYMKIEKDVFCNDCILYTVNMDLWTQFLDFCIMIVFWIIM